MGDDQENLFPSLADVKEMNETLLHGINHPLHNQSSVIVVAHRNEDSSGNCAPSGESTSKHTVDDLLQLFVPNALAIIGKRQALAEKDTAKLKLSETYAESRGTSKSRQADLNILMRH